MLRMAAAGDALQPLHGMLHVQFCKHTQLDVVLQCGSLVLPAVMSQCWFLLVPTPSNAMPTISR
jgi:hypothetical protein